ncbi:hypothetical protein [Pandoraea pulmonicola]|uniref:Uncharacterized protein n=2 Tax=Pandoraea pulmonicola TaxID=93221 RepID=A0AAJ5D1R9_PANPU|nr:hypothetical protein [Pandoraea pulmonicola]SUA92002.1 Uncharacterised protein [Pandoraea pulmonicola]
MPTRPSSMPFPFLPVVLASPPASRARTSSSSASESRADRAVKSDGAGTANGGRTRAGQRTGAVATPPGLDAAAANGELRVEVVRRIAREDVTLLGAIVR